MSPKASNQISYRRRMETPAAPGFEIRIDGVWRAFRDQQAAAYDAARLLEQRNRSAAVTITSTATGAEVTMLEDGRTA